MSASATVISERADLSHGHRLFNPNTGPFKNYVTLFLGRLVWAWLNFTDHFYLTYDYIFWGPSTWLSLDPNKANGNLTQQTRTVFNLQRPTGLMCSAHQKTKMEAISFGPGVMVGVVRQLANQWVHILKIDLQQEPHPDAQPELKQQLSDQWMHFLFF